MQSRRQRQNQKADEMDELPEDSGQIFDTGELQLPPGYDDNTTALRHIAALMRMADSGNALALRFLHGQCTMIARFLNEERHISVADSVTTWPIIARREKSDRDEDLARAKQLRIGGTAAAGKGRPRSFERGKQRAFTLEMLYRVETVDIGARSLNLTREAHQPEHVRDVLNAAGLESCSYNLFWTITELPNYRPETRDQWISVLVAVSMENCCLIPLKIRELSTSTCREHDAAGRLIITKVENFRGLPSALHQVFTEVLEGIEKMPDFTCGDW